MDNRLPKRMGGEHAVRALPPPTPTSCKTRSRLGSKSKSVMVRRTARTPLGRSFKSRVVLSETRVLYTSPFRVLEPLLGEDSAAEEQFRRRKKPAKETYDYLAVLGNGVCGVVHKVRSRLDGGFYALKRYKQAFTSLNERRKILSAMTIWSEIKPHPNVVPLYRAWQQDGYLCMQMQLCAGGNLQNHVDRSKAANPGASTWKEPQLWRCLRDSLLALSHIHAQGFVHNDVKPGNLYMADDAQFGVRVMLGDFDKVTRLGVFSIGDEGDARYMAKEILEEKCSAASDLFSLGISFYQLACDVELPENGELWHVLRDGNLPRFSEGQYSEELFKLLKQLMSPDPANRSTAQDILATEQHLVRAASSEIPLYRFADEATQGSPCYEQEEGVEEEKDPRPKEAEGMGGTGSGSASSSGNENVNSVDKNVESVTKELQACSSIKKRCSSGSWQGSESVAGSEGEEVEQSESDFAGGRKTPRRSLFAEFEGMDQQQDSAGGDQDG